MEHSRISIDKIKRITMNKTYVLLKDLPDNNIGDLFKYDDRTGYYEHYGLFDRVTKFLPRVVEEHSDWFSLYYDDDKIEISCEVGSDKVTIKNKEMSYVLPLKRLLELVKQDDVSGWNDKETAKLYTRNDMFECFKEARKGFVLDERNSKAWWSFNDYLTSKK